MLRRLILILFVSILISLIFGCGGDDDEKVVVPPPVPDPRVVVEAHPDPGLNSVDHAVWDSIEAEEIPVGTNNPYNAGLGFRKDLTASMKALIADDTVIYIRIEWNDNSEDNRFGGFFATWYTVGSRVKWEAVDTTLIANEDRCYLVFDNGGTNGADCASLCHSTANASGKKFYGAAGDNADIWHWKAHRTGLAGFAEDMHTTATIVEADPQDQSTNDDLYFVNWHNPPGTTAAPRYMHPDSIEYTGPGLIEGTYVVFSSDAKGRPWATETDTIGYTVPGHYLNPNSGADGSRWDVKTVSEHDGANWTIVFRRSLTTGDANDISFDFSTPDSISISIALGDNSGMRHHGREPFYLVFE